MVVYQEYSKRKISAGRYVPARKKRLANMGSMPAFTKLGETKVKIKRKLGGTLKLSIFSANKVNVLNPKTKKSQVTDIISVIENPANRNFVRRSIITKGAILETKLGKVKVTSRPGQEGAFNGILIA